MTKINPELILEIFYISITIVLVLENKYLGLWAKPAEAVTNFNSLLIKNYNFSAFLEKFSKFAALSCLPLLSNEEDVSPSQFIYFYRSMF